MKICLVSQQLSDIKSGLGVYTFNLAKRLLDDGHDITLIIPEERESVGIPNLRICHVSNKKIGESHIRWLRLSWRFGRAIKWLYKQFQFDIVHFTDAREALFCPDIDARLIGNHNDFYFATVPGNPLVFKRDYVDWMTRWGYYRLVHFLEPRALNKLDAIVCNSKHCKEVLAKAYHLPEERLHVVYKSIDLSQYTFNASKPEGDPRVLFVGGNMQRKGLPDLIRAAPLVLKRSPRVKFVIIGSNRCQPDMEALTWKYNVQDSFYWHGWRDHKQVLESYQRAVMFVLPAIMENIAITFLEAMAQGVPVITTDVPANGELFTNSINGLLVPPHSPAHLANAIINLLEDEQIRQKLIHNGLETVKGWNVEKMLRETYALYKKICPSVL